MQTYNELRYENITVDKSLRYLSKHAEYLSLTFLLQLYFENKAEPWWQNSLLYEILHSACEISINQTVISILWYNIFYGCVFCCVFSVTQALFKFQYSKFFKASVNSKLVFCAIYFG